ncbi:DUF2634 domain-containing protein [Heyndrickxia faecalis]|uniref:DUF2634 domain-containing protein n=1 Tax=Heyndrickxia TaxID=2837504 RepID=UPI002E214ADC|nr:DUF2634 domain-containing protein [Weizmannia sp. CD-2023]
MISPKIVQGDIVIENGEVVMVDGDEELVQSIRMLLQTRKGEFFLEPEHGLSFDNIIGKEANQDETHDDIVEAISQEDRIESVEKIDFNDDNKARIRSISVELQKADGNALNIEGVDIDA